MKVGEVVGRLNNRESLALVAKQIGMSPYTLSKKLRLFGYEYDSNQKKRIFVGEGEEPVDINIIDTPQSFPIHESINYQQLMLEELEKIRLLLDRQKVHIDVLQDEKRLKRTFLIGESVLYHLDEIAKKTGQQKSKIVEKSLREWLNQWLE